MKESKKLFLSLIMVMLLICGCGGGSDGTWNEDFLPNNNDNALDMSGVWEGSLTAKERGEEQISFELTQNGSDLSGKGTFITYESDDVTGSVEDTTVTISAIFTLRSGREIEFAYEGTVEENTFSGTFAAYRNGNMFDDGTFSLSKNDSTPDPDAKLYEVEAEACFQLSTGNVKPGWCEDENDGDIQLWQGAKVDLSCSDGLTYIFCVQNGTYSDLESVPSDYSGCDWQRDIEGSRGLENTGLIIRDISLNHHYKMRIVENDLPTLTFEYEQID